MNRYLSLTRSHSYSLLFALPLLLIYEVGAIYISRVEGSGLRNGADVLLRMLLSVGGLEGTAGVTLAVMAAAALLIILERRKKKVPLRWGPFVGMAAESMMYASVLGLVVGTATQWVLQGVTASIATGGMSSLSVSESLVLSLGAGLYEELVFRVLLVGGVYALLRGSGLGSTQAGIVSILVSSIVFSAFHYIGPYGDPLELSSFTFRFLAGVVFSILFLTRGFGITAWSHALYDVMLVFAMATATA
jgi:hypothetical protein